MPSPDNSAPTNMLSTVEALAPETRAKVDELQRTEAPAYRLAALDPDFMLGDSTRGVRFQLEYAKAQEGMKAAHIRSTIVVFGSARVSENAPGNRGRWYKEARDFGYIA